MKSEYKELLLAFFVLGLFSLVNHNYYITCYLALGIVWNIAKHSLLLYNRSQERKYRFSFVRLFYFYNRLFPATKYKSLNIFINCLPITIFIGPLGFLLETSVPIYYAVVGSLTYEVIRVFKLYFKEN